MTYLQADTTNGVYKVISPDRDSVSYDSLKDFYEALSKCNKKIHVKLNIVKSINKKYFAMIKTRYGINKNIS